MISCQWCEELADDDRDEVLALVAAAAEYDDEAGFSRIEPRDVTARTRTGVRVSHLAVKARRGLSALEDVPLVVVAYLQVAVDDEGLGTVQFVVHPDYRSRGIATLLVEELGLDVDRPDGWRGTGARALRTWAFGTHPAAERLTRRFRIPSVSRLWTLFRSLTGPFAVPLDPVAVPEGSRLEELRALDDPESVKALDDVLSRSGMSSAQLEKLSESRSYGTGSVVVASGDAGRSHGFVWLDPTLHTHLDLRAAWIRALVLEKESRGGGLGAGLLVRALEVLRDAGAQIALMRIDPEDDGAVRLCRLLSFEQEEAHTCYQVGDWHEPPGYL
ncbi:GNAT family N-acetyltransferase [Rhodococcus jostii]|uniref:Mycothiol synthase n=1 Tax=Rhodococcus jostii TaxID=132919 RepID=A0A1H4XZM5_RHOJO|nr:GNAT family N-acetyltransferase [Rhodococcus jostii]SED11017.1 mycothiol synthase [Rhodococcus jostii]